MKKAKEQEYRRKIAIANYCRGYLHIHGFITDKENENIHKKVLKYRDKHNVIISDAQLCSVEYIYDDNAKDN